MLRAITATPPSASNLDGHGHPLTSMTFSTPELHRIRAVERRHLAAGHRRAGDDGILHAGQPHVGTIMSLARRDVVEIDDTDLALAKVTEILGVLELEAFRRSAPTPLWHRQPIRQSLEKWENEAEVEIASHFEACNTVRTTVQLTNSHKI